MVPSMAYPSWSYFPRHQRPPEWAYEVVHVTASVEETIHTRVPGKQPDETSSDAVLRALTPGLVRLGYEVETGKKRGEKVRRPVLFGDDGRPQLTYEVDAFHDAEGVVVEVEAGRGAQNGADYRNIIRASLLLNAEFLAMWLPISYHFKVGGRQSKTAAYANTRSTLEAIYSSQRLVLPFRGVLLIGY